MSEVMKCMKKKFISTKGLKTIYTKVQNVDESNDFGL